MNDASFDDDEDNDPQASSAAIRSLVLRMMGPVVRKLDRVARGRGAFRDDAERQACVALARLAPALLAVAAPPPRWGGPGYHPGHTAEEAARLLARLKARERDRAGGEWTDLSDDHDVNDQHAEES